MAPKLIIFAPRDKQIIVYAPKGLWQYARWDAHRKSWVNIYNNIIHPTHYVLDIRDTMILSYNL